FFPNGRLIHTFNCGLHTFEDSVDNELNKEENFKLANDILGKYLELSATESRNVVFNYNECISIKREIEKEMEEEKSDIDFL
ncbi:TPA: hypothetical protein U2J23_003633, partial [Clostridioides difficile]|nr:hypothetical protein [Clostridioides difficile]